MTPTPFAAEVDHVVIAASTLQQGARWCEATFGVTAGPGGKHALFGTHNRLLRIDSAAFPQAYLEIISIDPEAPPPARPRWFGLDDAVLRARLAAQGPSLLHVVVRTTALDAHLAALAAEGIDAGEALAAERPRPEGVLRWRIAVRRDGTLLHGGVLPTLIEWGAAHPTHAMPASAVRLRELSLAGLPSHAAAGLRLRGVDFVAQSAAGLRALFDTPRGPLTLESA